MVVGESPEWLPAGFVEKVKYKNGRKIKYFLNEATGKKYHSKKEVILGAEDNNNPVTPQKEKGDVNGLSDNKVVEMSVEINDSAEWLPDGWKIEEKTRHSGSSKGSVYKVYTDLSSGSKFYSKAAVTRYLNTLDNAITMTIQNEIDNVYNKHVDGLSMDMSLQFVPMANTGSVNNVGNIHKVDKPPINMPPQSVSMTNKGGIHEKKRKDSSFVTVGTVRVTDDDLPPGWIKEVKTSKSGKKIRKDLYYTDPISGYIFRSKPDALRYLKTNDIGSCVIRPLKAESCDVKSIENEITIDNVDDKPNVSMKNKGGIHEEKRMDSSFLTVANVHVTDDDLPPGWIKEVKTSKSGNKIRKDLINNVDDKSNVDEPSKDMSPQPVSMTNTGGIQKKKRKDSSSLTVANVRVTDDDLPPGWIKEIKTSKSGNKIRKDSYYTDPISGYIFRSKLDALRYLKTNDIGSCTSRPQRRELGGVKSIENEIPIDNMDDKHNVDEPSKDLSQHPVSMINTGGIHKKRKDSSSVTVATVSTTDDDLPPGWIKEIKTSKSGNKLRKDPYYRDPVSGYIFRSKLDALRYLQTNDISSCACRPLRREPDDVKLIADESPSSNQAKEKVPVPKRRRLHGGESSGAKALAESEANVSEQKQKGAEIIHNLKPGNDVPKEDSIMPAVGAIGSPVTDQANQHQFSENGNQTKVSSRKSKKREALCFPSRTSKRLAGSHPEMASITNLNERSLRVAARKSSVSEVDKTKIEPPKDAAQQLFIGKETRQDTMQVVEALFGKIEELPTSGPTIQEPQSDTARDGAIHDGKRPEESQQLCYDFGDSWSDPLDFAFKTLRGEIPVDDPLAFPGCFNEQISIPYNQDGCSKQSQFDAPDLNEFASPPESSKQKSDGDQFPANSVPFSLFGSPSYNCQSDTEVGKKNSQTKFHP